MVQQAGSISSGDLRLVRLHNIGRFHSGAQPLVVANTSALSSDDIKAAIQEYVDDEETETESEEGDATA
ncbi:hypothetical protein K438DRAFT_1968469 [Mycena galopus ATCC 62051]|nr:hypothetical protein K438DRAFT_1968469 [Mycena galopus ATCC 62051]